MVYNENKYGKIILLIKLRAFVSILPIQELSTDCLRFNWKVFTMNSNRVNRIKNNRNFGFWQQFIKVLGTLFAIFDFFTSSFYRFNI